MKLSVVPLLFGLLLSHLTSTGICFQRNTAAGFGRTRLTRRGHASLLSSPSDAADVQVDSPEAPSDTSSEEDLPVSPISAAPFHQRAQESSATVAEGKTKRKVVIIGGGWAGFGAAKRMTDAGYNVTLLDASENPGGLSTGWRTEKGRPVEAGMKGFWFQYPNIFSLLRELNLSKWPLTPCTKSAMISPDGLECVAPVMQGYPRLPSPLGLMAATSFGEFRFRNVPLQDRASMLPLLAAIAEHDLDDDIYAQYDQMSAAELFKRCGVAESLYERFLRPVLLVGLFAPPEKLSAAVVLGMLKFYVLGHQPDFDVCWCRGSVSEEIFQPFVRSLEEKGADIRGGSFVREIKGGPDGRVQSVVYEKGGERIEETADAVVLAVGVKGLQKIVGASPLLRQQAELRRSMNVPTTDVMSVRIWFDKEVPCEYPSNVFAGFDRDVGGTFFHLNVLHDECRKENGTVYSCDFYHCGEMLPLSDKEIVDKTVRMLSTTVPAVAAASPNINVVDSSVLRFPGAVTLFGPGSFKQRPRMETPIKNLFLAADWVRDLPHGAQGLSQERAYVAGLYAGNLAMSSLEGGYGGNLKAGIREIEGDEPQVEAAREAVRKARQAISASPLRRLRNRLSTGSGEGGKDSVPPLAAPTGGLPPFL
uniref:Amine oxidase domain-containing protein n=1 Tax=Chromera velia CCMP2878 TaxID=1169474 RepID=A0A0G4HSZ0_9ALVE|eukprot:Cvel_8366.t1-p1 / transcript=Cvel_8366.t1 / gene=Cvel_8366 / organism=Chromera_velia_CCMP2878 / gene_product=Phytoene dehydrogenase, chloroplastic/chromoplastic, putative / transcript_product=Phytoene dehydrogenase, chloroplastic/chromoplastic, putative / location=Cvel_scaffold461:1299-7262(+) / protein_length=645 / sequence_SO=supercontig / SO=protein_coding / is_pseudo=false